MNIGIRKSDSFSEQIYFRLLQLHLLMHIVPSYTSTIWNMLTMLRNIIQNTRIISWLSAVTGFGFECIQVEFLVSVCSRVIDQAYSCWSTQSLHVSSNWIRCYWVLCCHAIGHIYNFPTFCRYVAYQCCKANSASNEIKRGFKLFLRTAKKYNQLGRFAK